MAQRINKPSLSAVKYLSVGYLLTNDGTPCGDGRSLRFSWMPYEVSCVACPADTNAGFFRNHQEQNTMLDTNDNTQQQTITRSQRIAEKNSVPAERERVTNIMALGKQFSEFGTREMADEAISIGMPVKAFTDILMEHISDHGKSWSLSSFGGIGMKSGEIKRYSICRAIEAQLTGDWRKAGFEREIHETLARDIKHRSVTGILVPAADLARAMKRDLLTSSPHVGGNLVGTDHRPELFVDALRENSAVLSLGAQYITGLIGNVDIPVLSGDVTPSWMATETSLITESQPTFGQCLMTPKSCAAYTQISRRLLRQSAPAAEQIVINSMMKTVGFAIDKAAIQGSGTAGEPKGLLLQTGIGSVVGTTIDWAHILEFEADVAAGYVDLTGRSCGFVTTPAVRQLLKGRVKVAGYPEYLWQSPDNRMNGYASMATSACPTGTLIFGDWSEIMVAEFGPIEITVNPFDGFQNAIIGVRAIADIDIGIKHGGAFSVATSVT